MTSSGYEVPEPILNSPFEEPKEHWRIEENAPPLRLPGRRPAMYYYKPPNAGTSNGGLGYAIELKLINLIRERIKEWKSQGYPGTSRVTLELLAYWQRDGRQHRLFFAQLEAAETIIFLKEARSDYLQGIEVPFEELPPDRQSEDLHAFYRYALKMATGSGKTTVMAMLIAWSILNKVTQRGDSRFSDVALVVCPNVTIRRRLAELDPKLGEASLYRTRDIVPHHLVPDLSKGRVLITNWHVFEPKTSEVGGTSSRVVKTGEPVTTVETIRIGTKTTTARGKRYLTQEEFERQINAGVLVIKPGTEKSDLAGNLISVDVIRTAYVESDSALVKRVLGREIGGKQNILVFNDEAHHAYRIQRAEEEESTYTEDFLAELLGDEEDAEIFTKEATIWVDGLDKIHKLRGINFCVDLSATPYYLGGVGQQTNRIFPWTVCDFDLTDAIESGLVKIPQLAVRDTTGADMPGYFNIWKWILDRLTPAERGARGGTAKPEAVLKWAYTPIVMLAGLWEKMRREWQEQRDDPRPPVFILVCKNTKIAKVIYEWLAEDNPPIGIPPAGIEGFRNKDGKVYTIRVDSKVVAETDTGETKNDEFRWMRLTLDTVGRMDWTRDSQGRPLYPNDFEELAKKLGRPMNPPGRDIRCIVSVGMLTEGWDCTTVTHIIGLRPFMSQLLCEQVVGRGLRRTNYDLQDGKLPEEVAKIFGVPFEIIPFKANPNTPVKPEKRHHVTAVPQKASYEIHFPRVQGYRQAIRNRIALNWESVAPLKLDPLNIPPEVQMKAGILSNRGRPSLLGPGKLESVDLNPYRAGRRYQELVFELAKDLTRVYVTQSEGKTPAHVFFPQLVKIVERYLHERVNVIHPYNIVDVFLSPYYGWVIENLLQAISPDITAGESPEIPIYETNRGPGSTSEVSFWTSREVREVVKSHLNYIVADTKQWEQSAAYIIDTYPPVDDTHPSVEAFVKNAGLGFAIPYLHNGQMHDYIPDFIIRLGHAPEHYLILETKGYDEDIAIKANAADRWCKAVNSDGRYGNWQFAMALKVEEVREKIEQTMKKV